MRVLKSDSGYVLEGDWDGQDAVNAFLNHLAGRGFSAATVRAYAFDVANLSRFLVQQAVGLAAVDAPLVFDWIDWQGVRRTDQPTGGHRSSTPPAASTVNRRVAAVRALFEYLVMTGVCTDNPVPSPRRDRAAPVAAGCSVIWVPGVHAVAVGWCVSRSVFRNRCPPTMSTRSWRHWQRTGTGRWCW
ncbi:phage integrase, N-terminal SAM-like domain protein [Mycobacterium avium MAV_120809_2495]|nr:phage integrase, N-terminal SAM-like domain protein [Mycobacterium avium MAV_120809_2495]